MAKRRVWRYSEEFRRRAVERLKRCENITALAQELGVHRRLLYKWRDQVDSRFQEPATVGGEPGRQVDELKRLPAEKTLEVDLFKSALRKVEARRQRSGLSFPLFRTVSSFSIC